jgi:membrane protein implicated in regulation of membrane protease activity
MKVRTVLNTFAVCFLLAPTGMSVIAQDGAKATGTSTFTALLSWMPLLLLVVVWFVFTKHLKRVQAMQKRANEHMDRVEDLLGRITQAVESKK